MQHSMDSTASACRSSVAIRCAKRCVHEGVDAVTVADVALIRGKVCTRRARVGVTRRRGSSLPTIYGTCASTPTQHWVRCATMARLRDSCQLNGETALCPPLRPRSLRPVRAVGRCSHRVRARQRLARGPHAPGAHQRRRGHAARRGASARGYATKDEGARQRRECMSDQGASVCGVATAR